MPKAPKNKPTKIKIKKSQKKKKSSKKIKITEVHEKKEETLENQIEETELKQTPALRTNKLSAMTLEENLPEQEITNLDELNTQPIKNTEDKIPGKIIYAPPTGNRVQQTDYEVKTEASIEPVIIRASTLDAAHAKIDTSPRIRDDFFLPPEMGSARMPEAQEEDYSLIRVSRIEENRKPDKGPTEKKYRINRQ